MFLRIVRLVDSAEPLRGLVICTVGRQGFDFDLPPLAAAVNLHRVTHWFSFVHSCAETKPPTIILKNHISAVRVASLLSVPGYQRSFLTMAGLAARNLD
jgi:hypothetical protein